MSSFTNCQPHHILLAVTGGIAAYKSAILVRRLKEYGFDVRVVMTASAQQFVSPLTFQALSGNAVHTSLLDADAEAGMGHIELARWADLLLVAPASCNTLAKFAHGLADDLLSTLYLATKAPVWIAPAMNQQMWAAVATQRNLQQLQQDHVHILMPTAGEQACGDIGVGRMVEPEAISSQVFDFFNKEEQNNQLGGLAGKHVVITAGPTREAIDPVRYISNHSTGKMGFAIASACYKAGAKVSLIAGPVSLPTPHGVHRINVHTAMEMLQHSQSLVAQGCDIFIATAAVADYRVLNVASQKIKKSVDGESALTLQLTENPDIVATIAHETPDHSRPFMVGFAAETQHVEQYAQQKLKTKKLDMIACNDVSRSDIGFGSDDNAMTVFFKHQIQPIKLDKNSKDKIAEQLVGLIATAISNSE